jgi:hypothetical protein
LEDQSRGAHVNDPNGQSNPTWIFRTVSYFENKYQQRRAKKKQENPADRSARRIASATVWIALFTIVAVAVGVSQFIIFRGQLKVMDDQLTEMRSTGLQTDEIIKANKKAGRCCYDFRRCSKDQCFCCGKICSSSD